MIPKRHNDFYGDAVRWFMGRVIPEGLNDPQQLGRVKIRIFGIHTEDTNEIPDEDLPWAQVVGSLAQMGTNRGGTVLGIQPNATVFGFFLDGKNSQLPMVVGFLPKFENEGEDITTSKLATGENTLTKTPTSEISEPESPYAAEYPNNKVIQTPSGHVIEVDDTPDAERIHVFHKSGTFIEMHPNGDVVTQHKNGYRTVTGNDKLYVTGDLDIQAANVNVTTTGDITMATGGKIFLN